ncbi:Uncharacterised protein [uncultured archaeon]|nr:Uncharacterised protein [uncultured archaeon]
MSIRCEIPDTRHMDGIGGICPRPQADKNSLYTICRIFDNCITQYIVFPENKLFKANANKYKPKETRGDLPNSDGKKEKKRNWQ